MIRIDLDSPLSLEEQIRGEIRAAIARNEIRPGQSLPSVRQLGADLGIHWNTVARAYRRLRDEGLVRFGQGRGVVVRKFSRPDAPTGSFERERIRLQVRNAVTDARFGGLTLEDIREIFRGELKQFRA